MTKRADVIRALKKWGFIPKIKETRDYPFYGDRFTAYRRGTVGDYQKARIAYIRKYGLKSWRQDIKPMVKSDRMKIFWQKPSQKRVFFINRLAWNSESRIRESGKLGQIVQRGFR